MKHQYPILKFVLLLLFFTDCTVFCQQITFNKVPYPEGKTFDFVTGITQDVNGYMWFATKKGLYKYDGNHLTSYKNNQLNPNSLISDFLESVYADYNGIIWIGSLGKGLDRLDPETGIFTHFQHNPNNPASLSSDTVTVILRDKQGTLWVGTHGGLDRFDSKTNKFLHYRYNANDPGSISYNQVRVIYEDMQGTLWIGTGSPYPDNGGGPVAGGLNRMNKKTGKFTRYLHDPNNIQSLINNKVSAIFEDDKGVLWIGSALNGLHKMNRKQGTFERIFYDPSHPEKLSVPTIKMESPLFEHITFITQDAAGSYWIGTSDEGLLYSNPTNGKIIRYHSSENSSSGFTDTGAWKAFTSRDGILWIGGTQGNIYRIDPQQKGIPHFVTSSAPVNCFYEEPNGILWIGTNNELIRNDPGKGIIKRYVPDITTSIKNHNNISRIKKDRQGNIWIGSGGGLALWNKEKENFINYKHDPKNKNSISNSAIYSIYEDREANLWIGTFRGLNLMNRKTGSFAHYLINPNDTALFGQNFITSILQDKTGKLWIGSWNGAGVNQLNRKNNKFRNYLKGTSIVCIHEDRDGVLWLGAYDGLYRFNRSADKFIRYSDSSSITGISGVLGMIEDNQKYLWLTTSNGFVRINPQRNETTLYGKNFGVSENILIYNSCYKGQNGELYFGDATGYFKFFPNELTKNIKPPEILFTGFLLADKVVKPGDNSPLKMNLTLIKEIRLQYNQNIFSFDFTVIDYTNPEENRLFFKLENYDNSWHQANSERRAYFFNIPPGKYVFRIKAVNSYGVSAEKKIEIIILPPWWRTWWAYCIYALLLIAGIFGADRFQRQRLLQAERERTRARELAQAKEIEKAYAELKATQNQLIQSEKMASLGELTAGIAHEIQNPLNFVNNFSEVNTELIDEMQQEMDKGNLADAKAISNDIRENERKINHHGKRADAIVRGMLQHSRSSSGVKEPTDINALADEYLRLAYHGLRAKDKSFNATMKTDFDTTIGNINLIPQDIGRVILNLITNAFYAIIEKKKQIGADYEPTVTVSTKKINGKIEIRVSDNANGIPQNVLTKIFQPFFTTKPAGQGTGLGLSLAYDIVKAHGGELKVETNEGVGSEFVIFLPLINN